MAYFAFDVLFPGSKPLAHAFKTKVIHDCVAVVGAEFILLDKVRQGLGIISYHIKILGKKPLPVGGGIKAAVFQVDEVKYLIWYSKTVYELVSELFQEHCAVVGGNASCHDESRVFPGKLLFHLHAADVYPDEFTVHHHAEFTVYLVDNGKAVLYLFPRYYFGEPRTVVGVYPVNDVAAPFLVGAFLAGKEAGVERVVQDKHAVLVKVDKGAETEAVQQLFSKKARQQLYIRVITVHRGAVCGYSLENAIDDHYAALVGSQHT